MDIDRVDSFCLTGDVKYLDMMSTLAKNMMLQEARKAVGNKLKNQEVAQIVINHLKKPVLYGDLFTTVHSFLPYEIRHKMATVSKRYEQTEKLPFVYRWGNKQRSFVNYIPYGEDYLVFRATKYIFDTHPPLDDKEHIMETIRKNGEMGLKGIVVNESIRGTETDKMIKSELQDEDIVYMNFNKANTIAYLKNTLGFRDENAHINNFVYLLEAKDQGYSILLYHKNFPEEALYNIGRYIMIDHKDGYFNILANGDNKAISIQDNDFMQIYLTIVKLIQGRKYCDLIFTIRARDKLDDKIKKILISNKNLEIYYTTGIQVELYIKKMELEGER